MLRRFLSLEVVVLVLDRLESSTILVGGWIGFLCYCPRSLMGNSLETGKKQERRKWGQDYKVTNLWVSFKIYRLPGSQGSQGSRRPFRPDQPQHRDYPDRPQACRRSVLPPRHPGICHPRH